MAQNFKVQEVKAYSIDEAIENSQVKIIKNATQAWKAANSPLTGAALNDFVAEKLKKETKFAPGIGCIIVVDPGVPNSRKFPYVVTDIVNEKGPRKFSLAIQLVDKETNRILATAVGKTKAQAQELIKKQCAAENFKGEVEAKYIKVVTDGEPRAFEVKYTPSEATHLGTYLIFYAE